MPLYAVVRISWLIRVHLTVESSNYSSSGKCCFSCFALFAENKMEEVNQAQSNAIYIFLGHLKTNLCGYKYNHI